MIIDLLQELLEDEFTRVTTERIGNGNQFSFCNDSFYFEITFCEIAIRITSITCTEKRCGVGTILIDATISLCNELGRIPIAISVGHDDAAEGFWENCGFTPLDDGSRNWIHSGWQSRYESMFL